MMATSRVWIVPLVLGSIALAACVGDDGARGPQGEKGEPGEPGASGEKGDKGDPGANGSAGGVSSIVFSPVTFPETDEEKKAANASATARVNGQEVELGGYKVLLRSGDAPGGEGTFGLMVDQNGDPIEAGGEPFVSNAADFSSILTVGDKLYSVTHFEARPGAMYLTELQQDEAGELTAVRTSPIDFSEWGGLWVPCAGSVTPWGTHLGGEEYPPNARAYGEMAVDEDLLVNYGSYGYDSGMYRYFGLDIDTDDNEDSIPDNLTLADVQAVFNPYAYGYPVEVEVDADGSATATKHYAMGRVALELTYVMPDERTAYLSDDGTNGGLYMFVADAAGDLSHGTLYAAKWVQTSAEGAGAADLEWISLGSASDEDVDPLVRGETPLSFSDIFTTEEPAGNTCPTAGFVHTIAEGREECLLLNEGMELAASRLETRRYANYMGATVEFRKEEGITFDPYTMTLFVAMSEVSAGMEDGGEDDYGDRNDIRLAANDCGAVYALDVGPSGVIGSGYVAANMYAIVEGTPATYGAGSPYEGNTCSVNGIASPDNLTFVNNSYTLIIGEDTSGHQNDAIWAYDLLTGKLTRIMTTPYGSETTSPYWYPDINGFSYLKAVIQHPYGETDQDKLPDASAAAAYDGYIGPFPAL